MSIVLSCIITCLVTTVLMLLVDRLCYYRFRQKRVPGWTTVAVSMAVATFFTAVISIIFGSAKLTVYKKIPKSIPIFSANITTIQLISLITTVAVMIAMTLFLKKTKTGKKIRAISDDKTMARVVGIDVEKVYIAIISAGSVLASVSGIMYAMDSDLRPTLAATALLKAIVASIIGGVGNIKGALIAAFAIGLVENAAVYFVGSGWRDAIPLMLVIIALITKPSVFGMEES